MRPRSFFDRMSSKTALSLLAAHLQEHYRVPPAAAQTLSADLQRHGQVSFGRTNTGFCRARGQEVRRMPWVKTASIVKDILHRPEPLLEADQDGPRLDGRTVSQAPEMASRAGHGVPTLSNWRNIHGCNGLRRACIAESWSAWRKIAAAEAHQSGNLPHL